HLAKARPFAPALRRYHRALFEQLGATLARVEGEPTVALECSAGAVAALSIAQAIGRLRSPLDGRMLPPTITFRSSRLLVRLSETLRNPSAWKFSKRAAEARALGRHALATSAEPGGALALRQVIVGSAALGSDLLRARTILQGKSNAIPI